MALSFSWLKQIKRELKEQDAIPLTGSPSFPWEELSVNLANIFECENLHIVPSEPEWLTKNELLKNLATPVNSLVFTLAGFKGHLYWLLPEEEITTLESLLLTKEVNPYTIPDAEFKNGLYRFLALETLNAISQTSFDRALSPIITDSQDLPADDSLCMDIVFTIYHRSLQGRLVVSSELRKSLSSHYSRKGPSLSSKELANQLEVNLQLEVGRTQLSLDEWKKVSLGDCIILDRCLIDFKNSNGQVILKFQEQPIFKGELEGNQIKILDFPIIHEENTFMPRHVDDEDEDEDDLSDLGFDEDDEADLDLEDFDELDESLFKEIEEDHQNLPKKSETKVEEQEASQEEQESAPDFQLSEKRGPLTPDRIPLNIIVELGSIQLTMDKLLQIEPGNLLDISIQPENGVNLTINGKLIAKAELVYIGESLGVRILELG